MSLTGGTRFGPYEILGLIGAGGMGEVYQARDTRLDRTVAIKVLPADISGDPDRRARFEREAKTVAALSHPNICSLYDVGENAGSLFLVIEHLNGETLAHRLQKGPLPVDQVLTIATEIADALSAAHRQGIIHRDLKPGNVMLTKNGARLLDFGLAKLTGRGDEGALAQLVSIPTRSGPLTGEGVIVGTLQYMAPEQIEGKPADARTDLWALGAMLYEMVTGKRAFEGTSAASVMGAILEREPVPVSTLQPLTPASVDRLVRRCLAKSPDDRPDTAHDVASELRWMREASGIGPLTHEQTPRPRSFWRVLVPACLIAGAAIGAGAARVMRPPAQAHPSVTRTLVSVGPADRLQSDTADVVLGEQRPGQRAIALSPDGRLLVMSAVKGDQQRLYLRSMDRLEATAIEDSDDGASPFFSPDGKWIGFWAQGALKKIAVTGGPATTICKTEHIIGASWGDDDSIVFAGSLTGLFRVPSAGGVPTALTTLDARKGEVSHRLPYVLPGAKAVLFTVITHYLPDWDEAEIAAQPLPSGTRKIIAHGADARYVPTGHLIFLRSATLVAAPFNTERLELTGGVVTLMSDVMQAVNTPNSAIETGAAQLTTSASGAGLLAYATGGVFRDQERQLVWVDRKSGRQEPLPLPPPERAYLGPHLSPDGQQVVLWSQGRERVVWVYDLRRETMIRVTDEGRNSRAIWAPDSRRVTFASATAGPEEVVSKGADGTGSVAKLAVRGQPSSWSPDGKVLALIADFDTGSTAGFVSIGDATPRRLVDTRFTVHYPEFSPDGRWIAYVSDETTRDEVYVQAYPGAGQRQQVSNNGGTQPAWSRDGRELFYTEVDARTQRTRMMSVSLAPGPPLSAGVPHLLFEGQFRGQANTRGYDVTPDGQRFLMVRTKERQPSPVTQLVLVQNWFEELKAKVPAK